MPPAPVTCYVGLGSNLGDREAALTAALRRLAETPGVRVVAVSSLYETAPWGVADQPPFLNAAAELAVTLSPQELLARCLAIEAELGRVRGERWGPRVLDLDLLLCPGITCAGADLTLPHPHLLERQFVLAPLAEIAPDLILPDGRTAGAAADPQAPGLRRWGPPPPLQP